MIIGVPKEIKSSETRIALLPSTIKELTDAGHTVYVQKDAGILGGFEDEAFTEAGAEMLDTMKEVYEKSEFIVKVKEILPEEYEFMREGLIITTCLHSNTHPEEVDLLLEKKVTGIAYEDILNAKGGNDLHDTQSPIAGKGAVLMAAHYMAQPYGGPGIMLAKVPGVESPHVTVIGAGNAGMGAAEVAAGLGNNVTVLDLSTDALNRAKSLLPENVEFMFSTRDNIIKCLKKTDLLVNCVLWPKTRKDHLITREMLRKYAKKTLYIADVSCDIDGAIETCIKSTSHTDPLYIEEGIIHYTVDNIPAGFGRTSAQTFGYPMAPYIKAIANKGVEQALKDDKLLRRGLTTYKGMLTLEETAIKQNRKFTTPEEALGME